MRLPAALSRLFSAPRRRSYDAAGSSTRWPAAAHLPAPASSSLAARGTLARRTAYLAENSPHIAALVAADVSNVVGDGPALRHPNEALVAAWNSWWSRADAEGVSDLGGLLARLWRCRVIAGEAFVHLQVDDETGELRLALLAPEQVDPTRNEDGATGRTIVSGIEIEGGRRVGYWVLPDAPDRPFAGAADARRVPAEDICHVYEPAFPGQVRGVTPLAAVLTRAVELDKLEDALLARLNVSALFAGFVRDPEGLAGFGKVGDGEKLEISLEPGVMRVLPGGADVTFPQLPDAAGAPEFLRHMLRSIAAGGGLPYELVSHDLSQVNYSSARLGLFEYRRRVVAQQKTMLVGQLLNKVFRRFVALEILAGRIDADLETLADPTFIFPGWAPIDPEKEINADIAAIQARLKSRAEVISSRGRDPEEVDAELAAEPAPAVPERPRLAVVGGADA